MHYVDVDDVKDISNSNRGNKDDIDFEIVYRDGHTSTAELKSDMQAQRPEISHMKNCHIKIRDALPEQKQTISFII